MKNTILLGLAILLTGCAGVRVNASSPPAAVLPREVREPFHPIIRDRAMQKELQRTSIQDYPKSMQMEALLLKELSGCTQEDIAGLFDRLWTANPAIPEIVSHGWPEERREGASAILHHLLVSSDSSTWKQSMAGKLYDRELYGLSPARLRGYALHFHTYALLRSGRFAEARPFLSALKESVPREVHVQNLAIALDLATQGRQDNFVLFALKELCAAWHRGMQPLPDELMRDAVEELQARGRGEELSQALSPLVDQNVDLQQCDVLAALRPRRLVKKPGTTFDAPGLDTGRQEQVIKAEAIEQEGNGLQLLVELVLASHAQSRSGTDRAEVGPKMRTVLDYTSYDLISRESLFLVPGQQQEVSLFRDVKLHIACLSQEQDKAVVNATVVEGGKKVLQSRLTFKTQGELVIKGPEAGRGTYLIFLKRSAQQLLQVRESRMDRIVLHKN